MVAHVGDVRQTVCSHYNLLSINVKEGIEAGSRVRAYVSGWLPLQRKSSSMFRF